jgi:acetyl-CoA decarbonylase/synthase, CODH/ACS complex subunit delta
MTMPDVLEKWTGKINAITLGATSAEGGTRAKAVSIGGATTLPFLAFEGSVGNRAAVAVEVWDTGGESWPAPLRDAYGAAMKSPGDWAKKAVEFGADLICLRLTRRWSAGSSNSRASTRPRCRRAL